MDGTAKERYQRQTALKEFGEAGQQKLSHAKVLVIGAGGLGCPAMEYLAGAGIGTLGIVDHDIVSLSNLHRQVLYSTEDIGLSKAIRAGEILEQLNPLIDILTYNERLSTANALRIFSGFDIILDGTDNFASRYLINDASVILDKTLVYGAVSRFEGQVAVFNYPDVNGARGANYRDLFPQPSDDGEILNCEEAGVLGVIPGIIGTMMAGEALKMITGIGKPLVNRFLTYNLLSNQMYEMELEPRPDTRALIPHDDIEFAKSDYEWLCSVPSKFEIGTDEFNGMLNNTDIEVIDVREKGELPTISEFTYTSMPMSTLNENISLIGSEKILLFCQSGKRSLQAAKILAAYFGNSKSIYSLKGGISNWKQMKEI